jgi:hypothetical protein
VLGESHRSWLISKVPENNSQCVRIPLSARAELDTINKNAVWPDSCIEGRAEAMSVTASD